MEYLMDSMDSIWNNPGKVKTSFFPTMCHFKHGPDPLSNIGVLTPLRKHPWHLGYPYILHQNSAAIAM